ncbi:MAG: Fic family protein [Nanoarchaeota archaeon]
MTYIVKQEVKGHPYYYLVHNQRTAEGWKKHKLYVGKTIPDEKHLNSLKNKLGKSQPALPRTRFQRQQFLTNDEKHELSTIHHKSFEDETAFLIRFSMHTNGIEGSRLDAADTRKILTRHESPQGKKLREIYEAVNTEEAYHYIKNYEGDVNKKFLLRLHEIMMAKILPDAGRLREKNVKVVGAGFAPPVQQNVELEIERLLSFYRYLKKHYTAAEVAALLHIKFIELHPFSDGNGRVGRLLLNFILMRNDMPPIVITKDEKKEYFRLLSHAIEEKEYGKFVKFVFTHVTSHR